MVRSIVFQGAQKLDIVQNIMITNCVKLMESVLIEAVIAWDCEVQEHEWGGVAHFRAFCALSPKRS